MSRYIVSQYVPGDRLDPQLRRRYKISKALLQEQQSKHGLLVLLARSSSSALAPAVGVAIVLQSRQLNGRVCFYPLYYFALPGKFEVVRALQRRVSQLSGRFDAVLISAETLEPDWIEMDWVVPKGLIGTQGSAPGRYMLTKVSADTELAGWEEVGACPATLAQFVRAKSHMLWVAARNGRVSGLLSARLVYDLVSGSAFPFVSDIRTLPEEDAASSALILRVYEGYETCDCRLAEDCPICRF